MRTRNKLYAVLFCAAIFSAGCKKEAFVEANISPSTLYEVKPEDQFLAAAVGSQDDFEYYYDYYRALNLWMQYATSGGTTGNSLNFTNPTANFNTRYGKVFYERVGTRLSDGIHIIDNMPEADKAARVHMRAIMQIFRAYYAFYVSDINGSIPYTEAFQARYGGTITPKYNTQQELFNVLDQEVKSAVATLKTAQPVAQINLGTNDPFFGKDVAQETTRWAKAGNALRLKMAMRLEKRDPNKLKTIANEVIADPLQMESIDDSWVLYTGASFADANGNYNPQGFYASKPVVDFMLDKADPRLRIFYRPNVNGQYVGSFPSPDESRLPANQPLYTTTGAISQLQYRLFTPNYNGGTGEGFYPFLTYAEYCFLRADLIARGFTTGDAKSWYEKGVEASIKFYNQRAIAAQVENFVPVTQGEINAYLAKPGVAFEPAKAQEQIAVQAYLEFFRQPSEAWAWWKRTGYPNTSTVLPWANLTSNGSVLRLPRRASIALLPTTNLNYANQQAAIAEMAKDPSFGTGPNDPFGRVWWDMP
ncbi:MAG TPA: SusD/RagB family nutrient-binding outer membrane lipoprotein [Flavisolibacter sp.]|nr:SusD/RagB family nutrient-binding outer membrane lipoprotein [Flavisolibacter sp.]